MSYGMDMQLTRRALVDDKSVQIHFQISQSRVYSRVQNIQY